MQLDLFEEIQETYIQYDWGFCTNGCGITHYPVELVSGNYKELLYMISYHPNCPGEYLACKDCENNF